MTKLIIVFIRRFVSGKINHGFYENLWLTYAITDLYERSINT